MHLIFLPLLLFLNPIPQIVEAEDKHCNPSVRHLWLPKGSLPMSGSCFECRFRGQQLDSITGSRSSKTSLFCLKLRNDRVHHNITTCVAQYCSLIMETFMVSKILFEGVSVTAVIALRKHIVSTLTFFDKCGDLTSHAVPFIIL